MSFKPPNFLTKANYSKPVIKPVSGQRRSYEEVKNDTGFVFIGAGQLDIFNNGYSPL